MRSRIVEVLRKRRRERGALPSVRELAREFDASPQTVHKALQELQQEGLVHAIDRKGFYWGSGLAEQTGTSTEGVEERFRIRFHSDLRQGTYHSWKELPTRQALAQVYGVGSRCVGRILRDLSERGLLVKRGRHYFPAPSIGKRGDTHVLVVIRCDARGVLLLDTEREIEFLRAVRRELSERGLEFLSLGYCGEGSGRFLNRSGIEVDPTRMPEPLLGVIVSTWLVLDPVRLVNRLARLRLPISAWWEHPSRLFPRGHFPFGFAGFNLSFGASAGSAMGRYLANLGRLEIAYISPYHDNEWSRARLQGLREHILTCGGSVREFLDSDMHSPSDLLHKGGQEALKRKLTDLLKDSGLTETQTWVFANDTAAAAMHKILRDRKDLRPLLTGFDNTSDSECLGFDSFEFHNDGMVRLMLHHLTHPKAEIFSRRELHEMMGRMVVRSQ